MKTWPCWASLALLCCATAEPGVRPPAAEAQHKAAAPQGPPPHHLVDARAHPQYPPSRFACGIGRSEESQEKADHAAQAEVANLIRSNIQSVFEQTQEEIRHGTQTASSSAISRRIQVTSQFEHAELIHVMPALGGVYDGIYYAFAVLSREEAAAPISTAYVAAAAPFRQAARLALDSEDKPSAFTAAFRRAIPSWAVLGPKGVELRAIDPQREEEVKGDLQLVQKLLAARERVLAANPFKVAVTGVVPDAGGALAAAVVQALQSLGVRAEVDPSGSQANVSVAVSESCEARMGVCCRWSAPASIRGPDGAVQKTTLGGDSLVGCHRSEESLARHALMKSLTAEKLTPNLKSAVTAMVPVDIE